MKKPSVHFISLGCSKNLVDSEKLMKQFSASGFKVFFDTKADVAPIVVINTCGFIGDAKQESIDMILSYCDLKEQGIIKEIYVMGCLSQRYAKELPAEIPEVDGWFGKFDYLGIVQEVQEFVDVATTKPFVIQVCDDSHRVNGKSFMEMFCLNFSHRLMAALDCAEWEFEQFRQEAQRFLANN